MAAEDFFAEERCDSSDARQSSTNRWNSRFKHDEKTAEDICTPGWHNGMPPPLHPSRVASQWPDHCHVGEHMCTFADVILEDQMRRATFGEESVGYCQPRRCHQTRQPPHRGPPRRPVQPQRCPQFPGWTEGQGPEFKDRGPGLRDRGPGTEDYLAQMQAPWLLYGDSRDTCQSSTNRWSRLKHGKKTGEDDLSELGQPPPPFHSPRLATTATAALLPEHPCHSTLVSEPSPESTIAQMPSPQSAFAGARFTAHGCPPPPPPCPPKRGAAAGSAPPPPCPPKHGAVASTSSARSGRLMIDLQRTSNGLSWRGQQTCTFVDEQGISRNFLLHLPQAFSMRSSWPLLIYLHGGAGANLFERCGRSALRSSGLATCGAEFVVASPIKHTLDIWKPPEPWLLSLVHELQKACGWVDQTRIYLTGISMGAMAVFELLAAAPKLFAAAAASSGYIRQTSRDKIVDGICATPTLVVHSRSDESCKWQDMQVLTSQVTAQKGQVEWFEVSGRHEMTFRSAYLETDVIYRWLLQHRLGSKSTP
eukprot:gnl/TRDRNA2_/TRDRNA2_176991_c2_seq1.p1 gnl/TRDRNA2_/TRDRNA2_176991_c2~~gnl/TRDRNA2_/TRDRNA2_176991_c2_seq1.p1  ORF type:complete len:608 (-),score=86.14 gnl/TRDRNA2_/TRDRNA2_176991_c2_seq1:565-2166(-)